MPPLVLAHGGPATTAASLTLAGIVAGAYAVGCRRRGGPPSRAAAAAAVAALAAWSVAVSPTLRRLSDEAFAWHMVQHLVFTVVVPPLVVLARPGPPLASVAAMVRSRVRTGPGERVRLVDRVAGHRHRSGRVTATLVAAGVAAAVLWLWHLPVLYDGAVDSPLLHAVEHATLVGTSTVVWLLVAGRRTPRQVSLLALLLLAVAGSTLGGLLTFAPEPLYRSHLASGDPLADQQLAGLLMWVPGGLVPLLGAVVLTGTWLRSAGRRVELREGTHRLAAGRSVAAVVGALAAAGVVVGCGADGPTGDGGIEGADAARAPAAMERYGCTSCHTIPGVGGRGRVGPPLDAMGERRYIAGELTNTPDHMIEWLMDPQAVRPGSGMPDLGVTEQDARDLAAYLLQLEGG